MNSVLFCACTPVVRKHLSSFLKRVLCWPCKKKLPKVYSLTCTTPASSHQIEKTTDCEEAYRENNAIQSFVVNVNPLDSELRHHLLGENSTTLKYQSVEVSTGKE